MAQTLTLDTSGGDLAELLHALVELHVVEPYVLMLTVDEQTQKISDLRLESIGQAATLIKLHNLQPSLKIETE